MSQEQAGDKPEQSTTYAICDPHTAIVALAEDVVLGKTGASWAPQHARDLAGAVIKLSRELSESTAKAKRWQQIADQRAIEVADLRVDIAKATANHTDDLNAAHVSAAASVEAPVPPQYLLGGTRFKLAFDNQGRVGSFWNYKKQLDEQWVVLVPAADDAHVKAMHAFDMDPRGDCQVCGEGYDDLRHAPVAPSASGALTLDERFRQNLAVSEADLKEKLKPYEEGERRSTDSGAKP